MSGYVYRCDYCGELTPVGQAVVWFVEVSRLDDGRRLVIPGTYCGRYCGEQAARVQNTASRG